MANLADFFGLEFKADYLLLVDELESLPGVFVVYTPKVCLEIGVTDNLKEGIETSNHAKDWIKLARGEDIFLAFHFDYGEESKGDKAAYLKAKMSTLL